MSLIVRSPAFAFGDPIPARYTADGEDISPPLEWSAPPDGTVELALIMEDPDAPGAEPWIHWILYKIPADALGLPEGIPATPTTPEGLVQGKNSWGSIGYRGPDPPPSPASTITTSTSSPSTRRSTPRPAWTWRPCNGRWRATP